jgi:hypothetical protein
MHVVMQQAWGHTGRAWGDSVGHMVKKGGAVESSVTQCNGDVGVEELPVTTTPLT